MIPQDFKHVMLEGVIQYEIKEVLKVLILEQKVFTLHQFNVVVSNQQLFYFDLPPKPYDIQQLTLHSDDNKTSAICQPNTGFYQDLTFCLVSA